MEQTASHQSQARLNASGSDRSSYLQAPDNRVTASDIDWALHFEKQVHLGLSPCFRDIKKYSAIFNRLEAEQGLTQ